MTSQTRVTITAGVATLLGAIPLAGGFAQQRWFGYAAVAVMVVTVIGILLRRLRAPAAVTLVVQLLGLLVFHTVTFAADDGYGHIIPNSRTLSALSTSLSDGLHDIQYLAAPVPARTDIVILTSLAVGLLAVVVDLIAVSVQRPAVAGLALLALFAVATAVSARTLFFEFAGAGAGYLLLLAVEGRERLVRWGRVVGADDQTGTEHAVVRTPRHGAAGRVGVAAVAAALVIPMLVPGFTRNILGTIGHGSSGSSDGPQSLGSGLNPFAQLKGSLDESHTFDVMSVKSNSPTVTPWYLRVTVLDEYTPNGWRRSNSHSVPSKVGSSMPVSPQVTALEQEGHTRTVNAKVRITSYRDDRLPVYYSPTSVTGAGKNWVYDTDRSEVVATKGTTNYGLTYDIHAAEPDPSRAELLAANDLPRNDPVMRHWGQKPSVKPKVQQITNTIISGLDSPYERANAINDYFTDETQGFTYSLQTKAGSSSDALQNFLEQKQGYCEQYASAMAVMLRLAGVPSRVVLGYAQGTYDDKSKTWTISNHDAHAWVEGYFDQIGWVEFDPTPRDDGHTSQPAWQDPAPTDSTAPTTAPPSSTTNTTSSAPSNTQSQSPLAAGGSGNGTSSGGSTTPATVGGALALLALVALLLAPALARLSYRRRRFALARGPDPVGAAHACWSEILATMTDLGIAMVGSESPRATAARLVGERTLDGPARSGLSIVALAEERARYAAEAGVEADLGTALQAARSGLLAPAGLRRKIWITVAAPSVMQGVAAALAAGSARTGAAVAGLGRALRLRSADR